MQGKECTTCHVTKPLEEFYARKTATDGRVSSCKVCSNARTMTWRAENRDKYDASQAAWIAANPTYHKDWWSEPGRAAAIKAGWRTENPDRDRENQRAWQTKNKDKTAKYAVTYVAGHRDSVNDRARKRRARKKNAPGTHTVEEVQALWRAQGGVCANIYCFALLTEKSRHLDHIMPLARGGSDEITNLQWLCVRCNCQKSAKSPEEWRAWLARKHAPKAA